MSDQDTNLQVGIVLYESMTIYYTQTQSLVRGRMALKRFKKDYLGLQLRAAPYNNRALYLRG